MAAILRNPTFYRYWLPPVLWCAVILVLSGDWGSSQNTVGLVKWLLSLIPSLSVKQINELHYFLRKFGHVLAYGSLYFLWFRAFRRHLSYSSRKALLWALGLSLVTAIMDEGHQAFFRSRGGRIADVGLDLSGALLAGWVTARFWRARPRQYLDLQQPAMTPPTKHSR